MLKNLLSHMANMLSSASEKRAGGAADGCGVSQMTKCEVADHIIVTILLLLSYIHPDAKSKDALGVYVYLYVGV